MKPVKLPTRDEVIGPCEERTLREVERRLRGLRSEELGKMITRALRFGDFGKAIWLAREHDRRARFIRDCAQGWTA